MQNTKFIQLLKNCTTRERHRFRAYIESPFFNKNQYLIALYQCVLQYQPLFEDANLNKRNVWKNLFSDQVWNEDKMNNLISDLLQHFYNFLGQLEYNKQPFLQKKILLNVLLKKEEMGHTKRVSRRCQQIQAQQPHRNYEHFYREYLLHQQLDQYELASGNRSFNEHLQIQSNQLDIFYFANKLRLACDMTSRNTVIKAAYNCHYLKEILVFYKNSDKEIQNIPALKIYYKALLMLQNQENVAEYWELKNLLQQQGNLFPPAELWVLYNYALNFCIQKINSGQSSYYREILELYQVLLEKQLIFVNGYLTQWTFKNVTTVGIRLKEFEWTQYFIEKYQSYLLPQERTNAVAYNLAAFFYAKKEYRQALQQLQDVEFTDTSYHLGAKIIQLKSYFELEETEAFYSLIKAFRNYLRRNRQISDYRKKANRHFLKLAKKIYGLKWIGVSKDSATFQKKRQQILEEMAELQPLANKDWLEIAINHHLKSS